MRGISETDPRNVKLYSLKQNASNADVRSTVQTVNTELFTVLVETETVSLVSHEHSQSQ